MLVLASAYNTWTSRTSSLLSERLRQTPLNPDKREFFHTFRELIVGSYLARRNHLVRWQKQHGVRDLTPDWSILGLHENTTGLVEVMNFRADPQTEAYVRDALDAGTTAAFPSWGSGLFSS